MLENTTQFQTLFNDNLSVMLLIDPHTGDIKDVNNAACAFYGWNHSELCSKNIADINILPKEDIKQNLKKGSSEKQSRFIFKHRLADGTLRDVEVFSNPIKLNGNTLLFSILHDITDQKHAEEQLELFKAAIEVASDSVYWMDADGRFVYVNSSGCSILGYTLEELLQMHVFDINPLAGKEKWAEVWETIRSKKKYTSESIHRRKDGSEFPVEIASTYCIYGDKEYINGFARDITERKRTENELLKAQKLDSLGLLAGGIAHDFNNLMGGIFGYIDLALEEIKDHKAVLNLTKALHTIDRARGLTRQLLTFAKGGAPIMKIENLIPFIRETVHFALSGSNVLSKFDLPDNLWKCNFDKNQISQVIDNIVINAKQAMSDGGALELTARNITIPSEGTKIPSLKDGDYVGISIKDYGIGIPKEILPRIFDPFYTTKATGHGLGLTTCYSIVKRHGGCIEVESEPGKGCTFHIYLPAVKDDAPSPAQIAAKMHHGRGRFLIMDDEEVIRDAMGQMLETFGYSVVCRVNGKDTIDFLTAEIKGNRKMAGMILDLTIPGGLGGKETITEIRKLDSEIPVFVTSGYADDPIMSRPEKYGFTASICKPFTTGDLSEILNKHVKPNQ